MKCTAISISILNVEKYCGVGDLEVPSPQQRFATTRINIWHKLEIHRVVIFSYLIHMEELSEHHKTNSRQFLLWTIGPLACYRVWCLSQVHVVVSRSCQSYWCCWFFVHLQILRFSDFPPPCLLSFWYPSISVVLHSSKKPETAYEITLKISWYKFVVSWNSDRTNKTFLEHFNNCSCIVVLRVTEECCAKINSILLNYLGTNKL